MTDQEPPVDDIQKPGMYYPDSDSWDFKKRAQGPEISVEQEKEKEKQDWLDSAKQGREIATNAHKKAMEDPVYAKTVDLQKLANTNVDKVGTDEEKKGLAISREKAADESAIEENRKDFEKHLEKVKDASAQEARERMIASGEIESPQEGAYKPLGGDISDDDKKKFEERQKESGPTQEGTEKKEESVIEDKTGTSPDMKDPDLMYRHMEKVGSAIAQAAAEMGGSMVSRGWDLAGDIVRMTFTQPHAMSSTSRMIGTAMGSLELAGDFADRAAQKYGVNLQQDPELIKDTIKYKLYQREAKQANGVVGNTFRAISDSLGKMGVQDISQMTPDQLSQHVADMRQEASRLMGIIAKDKENLQLGKRQNRLSSQDRGLVYAQAKHLQSYLDQLSKQGATMAADQRMMARQQRQASRRQKMQAQFTLANGSANPYQQILQWADPNANWEIDGNTGMPTKAGTYNTMLRTLRDRREQERRANNGVLDPAREQWYNDMDQNLTQRRDDERESRQAPIRQYGNVFVGMSDYAPGIGPHINRILRFGIWPSTVPVKSIRDYLANIVQKGAAQGASAAEINHARALLLSLDMHTRTRTMMSKIGRIDPRSAASAMKHHLKAKDKYAGIRLDAAEAQKDEALLSQAYKEFNAKLPKDFATAQNFDPNDPAFQQALHKYERELIKYENKWFPLRAGNRQRQPGQAGPGQTPPGPGATPSPAPTPGATPAPAPGGGRRAGGGGKGGTANPAGNPNKGRRARYNNDLINVFTPGNLPDADRNTRLREIIGDNVLKLNKWGRFTNKEDFDAALAALNTYHETYNSDTSLNGTTISAFERVFGPNPKKDQNDEVHAANEDVLKKLFADNGITLDANGKLSKEEYKRAMNLLNNLYPQVAQDKKKRLLAGFVAPATPIPAPVPKPRTEEIDAADPASDADTDDEPEFFDDGSRNWVVMPMVSGDDAKDMESAKKIYDALGDDPKAFLEDVLQKVNTKSDKVKFTDVGQMLDAFGRLDSMDLDDPLFDNDVYMETKNRPRDDPVYQATLAASRVADMRPQLEKMGVWDNIVGTPAQPPTTDTPQTDAEVPQTEISSEQDQKKEDIEGFVEDEEMEKPVNISADAEYEGGQETEDFSKTNPLAAGLLQHESLKGAGVDTPEKLDDLVLKLINHVNANTTRTDVKIGISTKKLGSSKGWKQYREDKEAGKDVQRPADTKRLTAFMEAMKDLGIIDKDKQRFDDEDVELAETLFSRVAEGKLSGRMEQIAPEYIAKVQDKYNNVLKDAAKISRFGKNLWKVDVDKINTNSEDDDFFTKFYASLIQEHPLGEDGKPDQVLTDFEEFMKMSEDDVRRKYKSSVGEAIWKAKAIEEFVNTPMEGGGLDGRWPGMKQEELDTQVVREPMPQLQMEDGSPNPVIWSQLGRFMNSYRGASKEEKNAALGNVKEYHKALQKEYERTGRELSNPDSVNNAVKEYTADLEAKAEEKCKQLKASRDNSAEARFQRKMAENQEKYKSGEWSERTFRGQTTRITNLRDAELEESKRKYQTDMDRERANFEPQIRQRTRELVDERNSKIDKVNDIADSWSAFTRDMNLRALSADYALNRIPLPPELQKKENVKIYETMEPQKYVEDFENLVNPYAKVDSVKEYLDKIAASIKERYAEEGEIKNKQSIEMYKQKLETIAKKAQDQIDKEERELANAPDESEDIHEA